MKDFHRTNLYFSLCGLNCALCAMHLGGHCPGCGGGEGNQSCAIAKCSLQHGKVDYCFQCSEFPCPRYEGIEAYDSFITHQRQLKDIERAQAIGIEAYSKEQARKADLLHLLLSDYNDGRRKTFYCLAVNLLPLQDIENVMKQLTAAPSLPHLPIKEKAEKVVFLFGRLALQQGLVLKLRKKESKSNPT
ncbi:MAG: DUF3795 domain-containing protein [Eubacteriales bacterium]